MNRRECIASLLAMPVFDVMAQTPTVSVRGAGATFPAGVYSAWAQNFAAEKKTLLAYDGVGSGEGVRLVLAKAVDFGASDTPLPQAEIDRLGLLQFPTLIGGIAIVVNLPGVGPGSIKLSGAVVADIFLGRIDRWNDPRIASLNRGVSLPARNIVRVVREDISGTTNGFTSYLARTTKEWPMAPSSKVDWPGAVLYGQGNAGAVTKLKETEGAIAYVSSNSIRRDKLAYALLLNRSGHYVPPLDENLLAAVSASGMARSVDEVVSLMDQPGTAVWPMTEATYILMHKKPTDVARASGALAFFYWAFAQGDRMASDTGFVPLPLSVKSRVVAKFKSVTNPAGQPLQFLAGSSLAVA